MFFLSIAQISLYEFATVMEFIKEREVFVKESAEKNYSVLSYYLSKLTLEFPLMILLPMLENFMTFYVIGFRSGAFLQFQLIYWLTVQVGTSLGYFISSLSDNMMSAAQFTPFAVMPFVIFGGFVANVKQMPAHVSWF